MIADMHIHDSGTKAVNQRTGQCQVGYTDGIPTEIACESLTDEIALGVGLRGI